MVSVSRSSSRGESNEAVWISKDVHQVNVGREEGIDWSGAVVRNSDRENLTVSVIIDPSPVDVAVVHSGSVSSRGR